GPPAPTARRLHLVRLGDEPRALFALPSPCWAAPLTCALAPQRYDSRSGRVVVDPRAAGTAGQLFWRRTSLPVRALDVRIERMVTRMGTASPRLRRCFQQESSSVHRAGPSAASSTPGVKGEFANVL